MNHADKGDTFEVDLPLDSANADDFDALPHAGRFDESRRTPLHAESAWNSCVHSGEAGKPDWLRFVMGRGC